MCLGILVSVRFLIYVHVNFGFVRPNFGHRGSLLLSRNRSPKSAGRTFVPSLALTPEGSPVQAKRMLGSGKPSSARSISQALRKLEGLGMKNVEDTSDSSSDCSSNSESDVGAVQMTIPKPKPDIAKQVQREKEDNPHYKMQRRQMSAHRQHAEHLEQQLRQVRRVSFTISLRLCDYETKKLLFLYSYCGHMRT